MGLSTIQVIFYQGLIITKKALMRQYVVKRVNAREHFVCVLKLATRRLHRENRDCICVWIVRTSTPRFALSISLSILYMNANLCMAMFDGLKAWHSLGHGCKGVLHGWYSAVGKSTSNQPAWILSSQAAVLTNSPGLQQVTSVLPDYWSSPKAWTWQKAHGLQKNSAQWKAGCVSWWKGGLIGCMYSTLNWNWKSGLT